MKFAVVKEELFWLHPQLQPHPQEELLPRASKRSKRKLVFVFKFVSVAFVIVESKSANKIA